MVCKKDKYAPQHSDELPIPNLEVMCLLRSFASKGYVNETFNWQYYYYYLTNEGIDYLRQYLALPEHVTPNTHKKPSHGDEQGKTVSGDFNAEFSKEKVAKDEYRA